MSALWFASSGNESPTVWAGSPSEHGFDGASKRIRARPRAGAGVCRSGDGGFIAKSHRPERRQFLPRRGDGRGDAFPGRLSEGAELERDAHRVGDFVRGTRRVPDADAGRDDHRSGLSAANAAGRGFARVRSGIRTLAARAVVTVRARSAAVSGRRGASVLCAAVGRAGVGARRTRGPQPNHGTESGLEPRRKSGVRRVGNGARKHDRPDLRLFRGNGRVVAGRGVGLPDSRGRDRRKAGDRSR